MNKVFHVCILIAILLSCTGLSASAATKLVSLGSDAPAMPIELMQAPAEARLDASSLKGKVTVLEFWSIYCGPCIAAIPHINELHDHLQSLPIQFVSIAPEDKETLTKFLKKRPIKTWIGIDPGNNVRGSFGIGAIPASIIIGFDGKVAAVLDPRDLNETDLRALAQGKTMSPEMQEKCNRAIGIYSQTDAGKPQTAYSKTTVPLFQIMISAATDAIKGTGCSWGKRELRYTNAGLDEMIAKAWGTSPCRIVTNGKLPSHKYDARILISRDDSEAVLEALKYGLEGAFGLEARWKTQHSQAYILEKRPHAQRHLAEMGSKGGRMLNDDGKRLEITNYPLPDIVKVLESKLNKPVVANISLKENIDINIAYDSRPGIDGLNDGLATIGLRLRPANKNIKMLVVDLPEPILI